MTECRHLIVPDLSLTYLWNDKLGKFGPDERIIHVAAACSKPDLTGIRVSDDQGFNFVFRDLDLIRSARFIHGLKAYKEASILLGTACTGGDLLPILAKRTPDNAGLIGITEHTEFGAPLEDHFIFKYAVKFNCHTFLLYQMSEQLACKGCE